MGRPIKSMRRFLEDLSLPAGTRYAILTTEMAPRPDKKTGRIAWQVPGQYRENAPSTAVAGGVLYVQGHPGAKPA